MNLSALLGTVLPVIAMLLLGYLCQRRQILGKQGIEGLQSLVVNITLPATLLSVFMKADYGLNILIIALLMFLFCLAALLLGRLFMRRIPQRMLPFLTTGFEAGMMGYALFALLFGQDKLADFAFMDLGQVLFVFTVYMVMLDAAEGRAPDAKSVARKLISSPTILSIALGVLLGASGLAARLLSAPAGAVIDATLGFVSAPTAALILIVVGYGLKFGEIDWRAALSTAVVRLLITGSLCALMLLALHLMGLLSGTLQWAAILMFLLPPPFVLPVVVRDDAQQPYIASVLSCCTLFSLAAFAVMAVIVA